MHFARSLSLALVVLAVGCRPKEHAPPDDVRPTAPPDTVALGRADRARVQGAETAKLWVIVASDFQCPVCKRWHDESYANVVRDYVQTGKIRFAYLNYPIPRLHPNAIVAAEAAMCAAIQERFWPMHEALFRTQDVWADQADPRAALDSLAAGVGVDAGAWRTCMSTHAARPIVDADWQRTRDGGVTGTPNFFIGDRLAIPGYVDYPEFRDSLNAALKRGGGTPDPDGR